MSKTVYYQTDFHVTSFYGGLKRGPCVQITLDGNAVDKGYIQITREELQTIIKAIESDMEVEEQWRN